jgi:subtilase family serine protease
MIFFISTWSFTAMTRVLPPRPAVRRRPTLSLERLEDRQLLSTLASSNSPVLPPFQPAISTGAITVLPAAGGGGTPTAVYTPAQMRTAYGVNQVSGEGQGETIAIVDAYNDPNIGSDVNKFSTDFGLPKMDGLNGDPTLSILTPTGQSTPTPANGENVGWSMEISLDVEWAHSIAPYANIDLIECQNDYFDSLLGAEVDGQPYSSGVVFAAEQPGVVVVSDSWAEQEFTSEAKYDPELTSEYSHNANVAYTFSTGDEGAIVPGQYPAMSPDVVAVGGTSLETISLRGTYGSESGWSGSGGGVSLYEPEPAYQSDADLSYTSNITGLVARTIPDVSMDANPDTGVYVYDTYEPGGGGMYTDIGGTSLSSPMTAGVIALGDQARAANGASPLNSVSINDAFYGAYDSSSYTTDFHEVTTGNNGYPAGAGYNMVTGIGTPKVPAVVTLLGSFTPAAAGENSAHATLPVGSGAGGSGVSASLTRDHVVAVLPQSVAVANSSSFVGTFADLVTMDTAKPKKIGL